MTSACTLMGILLWTAGWPFSAGPAPPASRENPDETAKATPAAARAALAAGDARRALALLESRAMEIDDAERHSLAGRAQLALGDAEAARKELSEAVRLRPTHAADLHALGRALAASGAYALADARFAEAHWHGLGDSSLHEDWAAALLAIGETHGQLTQREWPRNISGDPSPGRLALGGVVVGPAPRRPGWVIMAPARSALYHAHRALELSPQRAEAHLLCARIWAAMNRHPEAIDRFSQAVEGLCGDALADCRQAWAESLWATGDFDGYVARTAEAMQQRGRIDNEELAACYDRAASGLGGRGEIRPQLRYLTLAAETVPSADRLIRLADALLQVQRCTEAVARLEAARDRNPTPKQRQAIEQRLRQATFLATPK